jgi:hypothetical protein
VEEGQKRCPKCGETKPLDGFNYHKGRKNNVQAHCRECMKEAGRKWYAENKEKKQEYIQRWQKTNPEKYRERQRRYREAHKEECRERNRKWRETNPEKFQECTRKWREANAEKLLASARRGGKRNQEANYGHLREMFGPVCSDCGHEYPMQLFHYHHLDPSTKTEALNIAGWRWERVKKYVEKDTVQLCPTCHGMRHYLGREKKHQEAHKCIY